MTAVPVDVTPGGELDHVLSLLRETSQPVPVTSGGETVAVVVSPAAMELFGETLEVMGDPELVAEVDEGLAELDAGKGVHGPTALAPFLRRG